MRRGEDDRKTYARPWKDGWGNVPKPGAEEEEEKKAKEPKMQDGMEEYVRPKLDAGWKPVLSATEKSRHSQGSSKKSKAKALKAEKKALKEKDN